MSGSEMIAILEDLAPLAPAGVVLLTSLAVVFLSLVLKPHQRQALRWVTLSGLVLALAALAIGCLAGAAGGTPAPFAETAPGGSLGPARLQGAFVVDGFGMAVTLLALLSGIYSVLATPTQADDSPLASGEYHGLLLLAVAGMVFLGMAHDLVTLAVSLEVLVLSSMVLAGAQREREASSEAALKYLVLSAFSTAFLLFGMAFFFGATGRLGLEAVQLPVGDRRAWLALAGLGLILAGTFFKVGAVPFHFWVPDVYQGAPTPVSVLLAVGVKAAAFAVVARILFGAFCAPDLAARWLPLVMAASVITMVVGNLVAMQQNNVKRLLAYSAIAHAGYLLLGFLVAPAGLAPAVREAHLGGVAFYLLAYGVATAGAFAVTGLARADGRPLEEIRDYAGLSRERPGLALCMAAFMLSLAGLPPLAGFFAKFVIFRGAVAQGFVVPAVLGVLASVASLYYYLRVILAMYMAAEPEPRLAPCRAGASARALIYGAGLATLALGLAPPRLLPEKTPDHQPPVALRKVAVHDTPPTPP